MTDQPMPTDHAVCEECGATLTEPELQLVLERGGPVLCSVHLAEIVELDEDSLAADTQL
jgi:hypothetical protein